MNNTNVMFVHVIEQVKSKMINPVTVKDCMTDKVISISVHSDVLNAGRILVEHDISGLPVVDDDGQLVGMLTEKDCFKAIVNAGYYDEPGAKVAEYMSRDVDIVDPDMKVMDIVQIFLNSGYRRFPVVSDNRLVGIVSRRDVVKVLFTSSWTLT